MNTLDHLDGLILSGGADINPLWVGEDPVSGLHGINSERDLPELLLTRLAYNRQLPILGICRGIQTLAAALGGKVCQDITATVKHSQDADRSEPTHSVVVEEAPPYLIYIRKRSYTLIPFTIRQSASLAISSVSLQRPRTVSLRP